MNEITGINSLQSLKDTLKEIGSRITVNIQFTIDYSIMLDTYTYRMIPRIKLIKVRAQDVSEDRKYTESFVNITDLIDTDFSSRISFKPEEDKSRIEKQAYVKFAFDGIVGQKFRFEDTTLDKEENQNVAFPPPTFDVDLVSRSKIPLSIPLKETNKVFMEHLAEIIKAKSKEIKEVMVSNYGNPKNMKCDYKDIYNVERDTLKLDVGLLDTNKTKFTMDGKIVEYVTLDDLRSFITLGTTLKNINVVVSKIWYSKLDKSYSAKFRLISCEILPRKSFVNKEELAKFGKEGFDESETQVAST
jgi:hypothetical protein